MRSYSLLILVAAAACGSVDVAGSDDAGDGNDTGDSNDHTDPDAGGALCEPDAVSCVDATLSVCDSDGRSTITECALGCADESRCADLVASNGLTIFLDDAADAPDVELSADTVIDTDDGDISIDGTPLQVASILLAAPGAEGGIPVRVFPVRSLTVTGDVTAVGDAALAFVSAGDIAIGGHVRTRAGRGLDGTGGDEIFGECDLEALPYIASMGGGGFGERGGSGGPIGEYVGGTAGLAVGGETLIPLRGGGNSASSPAVGGGALQLVSRTRIVVEGGSLDAGGQGGSVRHGGGAGGGILLEAAAVVVSGEGSAIAANGGGGGCGGSQASPARDGRLDDRRAAGCQSADSGGDGGAGGAGDSTGAGQAGGPAACGFASGGGGGGVGRIRINTKDGTFAPTGGAIVSPPASVGTVGVR